MTLSPEDRRRIEENRDAIRRAEQVSDRNHEVLAEAARVRREVFPRLLRAVRTAR